jgi:hypothetical protein
VAPLESNPTSQKRTIIPHRMAVGSDIPENKSLIFEIEMVDAV